ncbi:MAG: DUF2804 domain-containing protein [Gammaproteobacteria bacterium]|nr:DUF2804 domain-containing protein [Gammaproteobacteria bacterium]
MQNELKKGPLLDEKGNLQEAGFAFSLVKEYDRSKIKAPKSRIKEWDYYYIGNNKRGVAFTIDDNSLYGLGSVSLLNFEDGTWLTKSSMKFFTNGKVGFPSSSNDVGDIKWQDKNYFLNFKNKNKKREIVVEVKELEKGEPFKAHFCLEEIMDDSMVIATPFNKKAHFYYNEKKNCIKAFGYYDYKGKRVEFSADDTRAILDWGRGVWTYKNTWYWSGLSSVSDKKEIGFNLGYGFGDTSAASENMLFYDKKAYKLEDVEFIIPKDEKGNLDYMSRWIIKSKDNSIDLVFDPILDRHDDTDFVILKSLQHQVFGKFNGTISVKGIEVKFKDVVSFAERVTNYW